MSAGARWLCVHGALALLAGCAPGHIRINVKSTDGTNDNRPLYMLVRQVDMDKFMSESYDDVAALVNVSTKESSLLHQPVVIYPNRNQNIWVVPKDGPLAVYFLFTAPDGNWKTLLTPPLQSVTEFVLSRNRIEKDPTIWELPASIPEAPALPELPKPPGK